MNSRMGRTLLAVSLVVALGSIATIYALRARSAGALQEALTDTGKFKVGSSLGLERAGFSGRHMLQIFTSPESPSWPAISTCLRSLEVESELNLYTPILIDARLEPEVESVLRERDGLDVVVRGLNGAFLGGLATGFQCAELVSLLKSIRASAVSQIEISPIYAALLDSAAPVDELIQKGEAEKAAKFVEFLKEFEGEASPAALSAQARLGQ